MKTIVLLGAGGKMGLRLARNLRPTDYVVRHVEISERGREALAAEGFEAVSLEDALPGAEAVILAVPDNRIGQVARQIQGDLAAGTLVVCLDAAAPYAGELPERDDLSYFVTHPCHPPVVGDETTPEAQFDFFGGVHAKQHIVCALMQGPESAYADGEAIARAIFAPVMDAHRVTVDQMAILEPVLSETIAASCVGMIREATEEAVRRGVPRKAAEDFVLGHLKVEIGIYFQMFEGARFSDGALKAIEKAQAVLFQPDWKKVFEKEAIDSSIRDITEVKK
ncbi:MAG: semialdehyde dehydrogenase [Acidobacteria bacterium]|nr:semialdehyde dehydrogenase [Acidobacteriota bacterium]